MKSKKLDRITMDRHYVHTVICPDYHITNIFLYANAVKETYIVNEKTVPVGNCSSDFIVPEKLRVNITFVIKLLQRYDS